MFGSDAVEAGDKFVDPRVVFHRAGAERVHPEINCVVPRGQAREMADDFDFADLRKSFDAFPASEGAKGCRRVDSWYVNRRQFKGALTRRGLLEDQAFTLIGVPSRFLDPVTHRMLVPFRLRRRAYAGRERMFFNAVTKRSISVRGIVSVTQTKPCLVSSG